MPQAQWIICEQTGRWAALLRPMVAGWRPAWREVRSPGECLNALADAPGSLVTLELVPARLDAALDLLTTVQSEFSLARVVVVAARELAGYESLARELGALVFATSPRRLAPVVMAAQRHLGSVMGGERTLVEQIRAELPWG